VKLAALLVSAVDAQLGSICGSEEFYRVARGRIGIN
jgi:hypothetical protein